MRLHLSESDSCLNESATFLAIPETTVLRSFNESHYYKNFTLKNIHTQTKILIQSANNRNGQEDYAKEAIRFVRTFSVTTAMKEMLGRHSHFGHPYGACVQFRDALVCLVTTFPNSIVLEQHHQENICMIIYKNNVFPFYPTTKPEPYMKLVYLP